MAGLLSVYLNGELAYEHDRSKRLPGHQRLFLDKMDEDMNAGISMGGEFIDRPDENVRMNYVAMKLVQGILADNQALVSAAGSYISIRFATLTEIHAHEQGEQVSMSLTFE
jgi:hypothetical protein